MLAKARLNGNVGHNFDCDITKAQRAGPLLQFNRVSPGLPYLYHRPLSAVYETPDMTIMYKYLITDYAAKKRKGLDTLTVKIALETTSSLASPFRRLGARSGVNVQCSTLAVRIDASYGSPNFFIERFLG